MTTWWRRNRWFLVALVGLVPASVVVAMTLRWFPYVESRPAPESVALGETVRYSGADIELTDLRVLDGVEWNAPTGADVVVATLSIDVDEPVESYCVVEIVSDEEGFLRSWDAESYPDSDYAVPDDFATRCSFSERGPYDLQLTFLVPAGQVAQPVLQLTSTLALPRVLRLS